MLTLVLTCSALDVHAATLTSTWLGGTGSWSDPARWSGGVPQNTATDSYTAAIDGGNPVASIVTLSSQVEIDGLGLDSDDTLVLAPTGQLMLDADTIRVDGGITLQGPSSGSTPALVLNGAAATLSGAGTIRLEGAMLAGSSQSISQQLTLNMNINGFGVISGGSVDQPITNNGAIEADVAGQGLQLGGSSFQNYGTLRATNGGILYLQAGGAGLLNAGNVEASGGSKVYANDFTSSIGGTFSALDNSEMFLSGGYSDTSFVTDASSTITIGGGATDVTFDGNVTFGDFVAGTITNRGTAQGVFDTNGSVTFMNYGELIVDDMENATLRGGGLVTLDSSAGATPRIAGPLQNIDNTIRGAGIISGIAFNGGTIEAASGSLAVYSSALSHTGVFSATTGGTLEMAATVTGSGSWTADGGRIHVTGDVETTGDAHIVDGGALSVDGTLAAGNLVVDATGSLDVNGYLKVAGNLAFEGPNSGRWLFGPSSVVTFTGGSGAAIGDWSGWQRLEAEGSDLGPVAAGFTNANFYLPDLVIGPDGRVALRDQFDNGDRLPGVPEAIYVDTLVFSDALGLLDLNGLHLYYNHLVGSAAQILNVAVPEPAELELVTLLLGALGVARVRRRPAAR